MKEIKYYTVEGKKKSISKVFAVYYICMALFCLIRILAQFNIFSSDKWGSLAYTLIIQVGLLFVLPLTLYCLLIKVRPRVAFEHCNFNKITVTVVLISIVLGVLCFIINIAVSSLFNGILVFSGYRFPSGGGSTDYSTGNFFLQLFMTALLPAICEEFMHRGILLQGIKHSGFKKAILISSLLFALLHFNVQQVSYAFVVGLILGFVSVVAKNIYPAIIIHFVNNAIATYLDFASNRGWLFGDVLENFNTFLSSSNSILIFFVISFAMIVVVALLCLFVWFLYKKTIIRQVNRALKKAYDGFKGIEMNKPIHLRDEQEVILDLLENHILLNLNNKRMDNPIDAVMPKQKSVYKTKPLEKLFMWGAIVLGAVITLFTYTWGLF